MTSPMLSDALSERQREVVATLSRERRLEPSHWSIQGALAVYRDGPIELCVGRCGGVTETGIDDDDSADEVLAILGEQ